MALILVIIAVLSFLSGAWPLGLLLLFIAGCTLDD